jgi:hypothetical protein
MPDSAQASGHTTGGVQFHEVTLAVVERKRVALEALASSVGQTGGGIEPTA